MFTRVIDDRPRDWGAAVRADMSAQASRRESGAPLYNSPNTVKPERKNDVGEAPACKPPAAPPEATVPLSDHPCSRYASPDRRGTRHAVGQA